ncbi:MAG: thioredoxin domain-containing protein [bacterium]|nr:thioredoxin domain-containing protein [bacterium]
MNSDKFKNYIIPILTVIIIIGSFFIGSLYTKINMLQNGSQVDPTTEAKTAPQPPQAVDGETSVDDDPVIGDKNAPVTIVEFSDYECPFCKRHFEETYLKLVDEYVKTGKVKIVFRDLPLSFHDPMATKEAVAANCARQQGGDEKYFEFHDEIFKRTISNGNGLNDDKIQTIAKDLNLDTSKFTLCLSDKSMEDEVKKDITDAASAGATGTPTFIIGKSTDSGQISGDLVVGAQPFEVFQAIIDPLL